MQTILDFFSDIWNNITTFISDAWVWLVDNILILLLDIFTYFSDFVFGVFSSLVTGLSFDQLLVAAITNLDPTIAYVFGVLKIGSYIQIVLSAQIARFAMRIAIPWL